MPNTGACHADRVSGPPVLQPGRRLFPLSVDGIEIVASLVLLADKRAGRPSGRLPWAALVAGTGASFAANMAVGGSDWIGRAVSGWPAFALLVAVKLLFKLLERPVPKHQDTQPGSSDDQTQPRFEQPDYRPTQPSATAGRTIALVQRDFTAQRPNRCWVADFTHVATWQGVVYVAFVVDVYSRAIVGWAAATSKHTKLVLDALDMGLWWRDRAGQPAGPDLIHHSDAGSQYTSFRFTTHLADSGIAASIGTVGDALDNALMESTIGLYKTELTKPRRSWRSLSGIELATAEWVDWFNHHRLHSSIGHLPPSEYESMFYAHTTPDQPQLATT